MKSELLSLQEVVFAQFQQANTQSMNIQGLTLYIGSQLWAKKANDNITTDDMIRALHTAHLDEYAVNRVDVQGLSAYFRRAEELEEPVPECFKGVIEVDRKYEIKSRSA